MAQWVGTRAAKIDNESLIPVAHKMAGEERLSQAVPDLHKHIVELPQQNRSYLKQSRNRSWWEGNHKHCEENTTHQNMKDCEITVPGTVPIGFGCY